MQYKIDVYKTITQDDYNNGSSGVHQDLGRVFSFQSSDLTMVKQRLEGYTNVKLKDCEEYEGILQTSVLETNDEFLPTENQVELWKKGKINLFLADYSIYMEKIQSVNASELLKWKVYQNNIWLNTKQN